MSNSALCRGPPDERSQSIQSCTLTRLAIKDQFLLCIFIRGVFFYCYLAQKTLKGFNADTVTFVLSSYFAVGVVKIMQFAGLVFGTIGF